MSKLAEETGLTRIALYNATSEDGNPTLETLLAIASKVGVRLWNSEISDRQVRVLLRSLADTADHPTLTRERHSFFGRPAIWSEAEWFLKDYRDKLDHEAVVEHFKMAPLSAG